MLRFPRVLAALFVVGCPVSVFAQTHSDTLLTVSGDVDQPYVLSAAEFAKLPHTSVRAAGHDNKMSTFDGVLLADLLRKAGVKFGSDMRGARVAQAVIVGAADGYRAAFA